MNYVKILKYIFNIKRLLELLSDEKLDSSSKEGLIRDIINAQENLNFEVFSINKFSFACYDISEIDFAVNDVNAFIEGVNTWLGFINEVMDSTNDTVSSLDARFMCFMHYINVSSQEALLQDVITAWKSYSKDNKAVTEGFLTKHDYLWGKLDSDNEIYEALEQRVKDIKAHAADYMWLYDRLADNRSRVVLFNILTLYFNFDMQRVIDINDNQFSEYSDFDIIPSTDSDTVFVDCGAYTGDSAENFINNYRRYKKIYCYEAQPGNYEKMQKNLAAFENIDMRQKAVGDEFTTMTIDDEEDGSSLFSQGGTEVEVVPMDADIDEPISIVKMDIEGSEQSALRGMKQHILDDKTKLIICVYHNYRDLVEVPMLVESMRDDYKFYLRNKGLAYIPLPVDTVLYAV